MSDIEREQQLDQIEISIEDARATIDEMNCIQRLMENKDWQTVIEEGYFRSEASRLVLLKADPEMAVKASQKEIDKAIAAIGPFRQYLRVKMQLGMMAERAMVTDEQTRQELLEEDALDDEGVI